LKNVTGSDRELNGLLLRSRLTEVQLEKVRNVLEKEDFESISNYANTRYGASMRMSPLGAARHTQYGAPSTEHKSNNGSDGFKRNLMNMQHTFMSGGVSGDNRQMSQLDAISNSSSHIGQQNLSVNIQRQPQRIIENSS
jgi:hypothetical protein